MTGLQYTCFRATLKTLQLTVFMPIYSTKREINVKGIPVNAIANQRKRVSCIGGLSFSLLTCQRNNVIMRVIGELPHPDFKITIFLWNNRYLIKIEHGYLEQTYKIDQFDLEEKDLKNMVDKEFLDQVSDRFQAMHKSLQEALQRVENQTN